MSVTIRCWIFIVVFASVWMARPVSAQRGELIEGLFRTIAEAQLEREREKQAERMRADAATKATETKSRDPYQVQLPSGFESLPSERNRVPAQLPPGSARPPALPPGVNRQSPSGSINVRSREAAEFAGNLVKFNAALDGLVTDLRSQSSRQLGLRTLLPEAYSVAADGQSIVRQCDGLSSLSPIVDPYRQLDSRWRQLSFQLRSSGSFNESFNKRIRECDQLCSLMARQLQIQPQLDRHALHDLMIQAASYMQALLDDMELAQISSVDCQRLAHDCRLLRQRLLSEADHVDDLVYEDVVTRFTEFARQWSAFSQRVYAINDPHMNRRLDRIGECGDQTYALLWMPPPTSSDQVTLVARRLEQSFATMQDQLTLRALAALRREDQLRVMEASRLLYDKARQLETASEKGAPLFDQQSILRDILRDWGGLRNTLVRIDSISRATFAEIDRACDQLQLSLGISGGLAAPIDIHALLQTAAALEGASEYLDADLRRYERYLQPDGYRKSLLSGSSEFYTHAKRLHALLSQPGAGYDPKSMAALQREAEHMLDGWEQLSRELSHLDGHGLTGSRADRIVRAQQELVASVAQIAAALLER